MLERFFQLTANRTSVRREVTAGLTTFAAMAYILAVNPAILSASGMDTGAVITATALASALMTATMALATNYPIALAPGMGMNAFFAFTICGVNKIPWPAALGLVFLGGALFLALTAAGVRRKIIEAIPGELKTAIGCGIGLFILFIGLKNGGVVVSNPATFVSVGKLSSPAALLVLSGIALTAVLVWRKVRGAIVLAVLALTVVGFFLPAEGQGTLTRKPDAIVAMPASLAPTFLALDLKWVFAHLGEIFPLLLALLFVDLFDNMGTLIGVCSRAGLLDENGNLPKIGRALAADASAAMVGATLGTSTMTSYIESAAGVEEGGRTGLTSLVVSVCFLLALFFSSAHPRHSAAGDRAGAGHRGRVHDAGRHAAAAGGFRAGAVVCADDCVDAVDVQHQRRAGDWVCQLRGDDAGHGPRETSVAGRLRACSFVSGAHPLAPCRCQRRCSPPSAFERRVQTTGYGPPARRPSGAAGCGAS